MPGIHGYSLTGSTEASTTPMPCVRARSTIACRLSSIIACVEGPVLPATSLVPARITTTCGFSASTSCGKRSSICAVVWPLMPRLSQPLPAKNEALPSLPQPSVMESP